MNDAIAKNLLNDMTCKNCHHSGIPMRPFQEIRCSVSGSWVDTPKEGTCEKWKAFDIESKISIDMDFDETDKLWDVEI